jgi:hypothetical protein
MALAIVVITLVSAGLCHKLAKARHRSTALWISLGVLLGPIAVIALLLSPLLPATPSVNAKNNRRQ